jgi:hypothetical protein
MGGTPFPWLITTDNHDDRLFGKIAQSNVPAGDRDPGDQVIPVWT